MHGCGLVCTSRAATPGTMLLYYSGELLIYSDITLRGTAVRPQGQTSLDDAH